MLPVLSCGSPREEAQDGRGQGDGLHDNLAGYRMAHAATGGAQGGNVLVWGCGAVRALLLVQGSCR